MIRTSTPHGTARAKRREELATFHSRQCQLRDAAPGHRLPGDDPRAPLPDYYRNHLKKDPHDRS
jgi:hypothetical protein